MDKIEFPLNGRLRDTDVFRTAYEDGTVQLRRESDLAGFHLLELAVKDWRLGCIQEVWDLTGSGVFLSTANKELPSLMIDTSSDGARVYRVFQLKDLNKVVKLDPARGEKLLDNILNNTTHSMMSYEEFNAFVTAHRQRQMQKMQEVQAAKDAAQKNRVRPASQGPLRPGIGPKIPPTTAPDDFGFVDD